MQRESQIKVVALDWGGVLIRDPASGLVEYCAQKFGVDFDWLAPRVSEHIVEFQRGISESEFWNRVGLDSKISVWGEAAESVFTLNPMMPEAISFYKSEGCQLAFLSNTEIAAIPVLSKKSWGEWFDFKVVSCEINKIKPNKDIYEYLIAHSGVRAEQILFIDDKIENIVGARECGIAAWQYSTDEDFIELNKCLKECDFEISKLSFLYTL